MVLFRIFLFCSIIVFASVGLVWADSSIDKINSIITDSFLYYDELSETPYISPTPSPTSETPFITPTFAQIFTPTITPIEGNFELFDFNDNELIEAEDLLTLIDHYKNGNLFGDLNGDGYVDAEDIFLFAMSWQKSAPSPTPVFTSTNTPTETSTNTPTNTFTGIPTVTQTNTPTTTPGITETPGFIDEIIIDNVDAEFEGDWATGSSSSDKYGDDYRYAMSNVSGATANACFRPGLPETTTYEIFEWHPRGTNRANPAEIIIHHSGGETIKYVNQQTNGGVWISLGSYEINSGTDCYVKITNNFSNGNVVMADAIKFSYLNTGSTPTPTLSPTTTNTPSGSARPFGEYVQEVIDELEYRKATDVHGFLMTSIWGKYTGVTETLWYQGVSYMWNEFTPGEPYEYNGRTYYPYGHSYCSGLTLEIWHRAMKKRDIDLEIPEASESWNGLGPQGIFIVKKLWNVVYIHYSDTGQLVSSQPCPAVALDMSGIGEIITMGDSSKFEDVQPYDFCDISRNTGSGHSVIFINWIRDSEDNHIIGFRYYSTQYSTEGQGYVEEYFEDEGGTVIKRHFHAGRVYDNIYDQRENTIREVGYYKADSY